MRCSSETDTSLTPDPSQSSGDSSHIVVLVVTLTVGFIVLVLAIQLSIFIIVVCTYACILQLIVNPYNYHFSFYNVILRIIPCLLKDAVYRQGCSMQPAAVADMQSLHNIKYNYTLSSLHILPVILAQPSLLSYDQTWVHQNGQSLKCYVRTTDLHFIEYHLWRTCLCLTAC